MEQGTIHRECHLSAFVQVYCMIFLVCSPPSPSQQGLSLPPPSSQTEVWFEHRTADGRTYYSHPQTQKTTWERPQNAQIIPQPSPGNVFPTCMSWACIIWNEFYICQLQKVRVCYYQFHLGMKWPILPDRTGKRVLSGL